MVGWIVASKFPLRRVQEFFFSAFTECVVIAEDMIGYLSARRIIFVLQNTKGAAAQNRSPLCYISTSMVIQWQSEIRTASLVLL